MHAGEIKVEELFKSDNQLLVPLWQRRYAWQRPQWAALWNDLLRVERSVANGQSVSHFIGSVVLHAQEGTGLPTDAHRFLVVDGQQRITTLTILICAIRDHIARSEDDAEARDRVTDLYTTRYLRNSNLAPDHRERLVLQQPDRTALALVVEGEELSGSGTVEQAFKYFSDELARMPRDRVEALVTHIAKRFTAVWVVLEPGDNAHRVFQTLNSGGKQLDQSDLVRNYFFLLLGEEGDAFYKSHWKHLESDVPASKLQSYLAAWSISQGHFGSKGQLFDYFQKDLKSSESDEAKVFAYGLQFVEASKLYRYILFPDEIPGVSAGTVATLKALSRWGTDPAEGLLLYLFREYKSERLEEADLGEAGELILSYMVRRFLAGFAPNRHRSIFVRLALRLREREELKSAETVQFLRALLSELEGDNAWPTDALLRDRALATPIYTEPRRKWVFLVLERVNRTYFQYAANAPGDLDDSKYTVEHVLPQRPSKGWESDLNLWGVGSVPGFLETHLHVIGNLTLSATNSQLSNKRLADKQHIYKDDTLKLNQEIVALDRWDPAVINSRGLDLIARVSKAFTGPLSRGAIEGLGFFDVARDSLPDDVIDDSDGDIEVEEG
ncbi:DUF262 domain-containing protein [Agrococcus sp. SCSIO52902]|uniref:DUF262 domain-containing protein n=1 Tax=Agrococcus sp. SCSIO52902 TaxID=2933290 RepID=UPI001FF2DB08|nr:DUF262 domain-containing protein [Agrococcus sp. SCSIO52902]UOW01871.1 DUF262 domain-containing HNH endonuclease family protein [Agrococcus sp. SCSIO52902]